MSDYEGIYEVRLTKAQLQALKSHPKFRYSAEVESNFGGGLYNIGVLSTEREEDFLAWCEDNGIETKLV